VTTARCVLEARNRFAQGAERSDTAEKSVRFVVFVHVKVFVFDSMLSCFSLRIEGFCAGCRAFGYCGKECQVRGAERLDTAEKSVRYVVKCVCFV
jgi:hypothetical protein